MKRQFRVEQFSEGLSQPTKAAVRAASVAKSSARLKIISEVFGDRIDKAREQAARIKDHSLENLKRLLIQLESRCQQNGINVHWAENSQDAREIILTLIREHQDLGTHIPKAKSMATEEIHLNAFLEEQGFHPIETDLGEFVVQLDGDTPSHIVTPIIHKTKAEVSESFAKHHVGEFSEDAETLTKQAREYLRKCFRNAKVGISGVNFAVAESGRLILVENEGNNRLSTTAPDLHIALMGIEKVIEREADLPLFLKLLTQSATGQRITTYVHFIHHPRRSDEPDGPKSVHLILLDNGRSKLQNTKYRSILRCIRCGACLNICPVYRESSGHAYQHVYSGPLGAVLAPSKDGISVYGDLSKSSTLCGACEEVCPVQIPIPHHLLELRADWLKENPRQADLPWGWFGIAASDARKWRFGLTVLPMVQGIPNPISQAWGESREIPTREGRDFRRWWHERS